MIVARYTTRAYKQAGVPGVFDNYTNRAKRCVVTSGFQLPLKNERTIRAHEELCKDKERGAYDSGATDAKQNWE